ncbi:hypothetical protein YC2023_016984 [Brassica napus]
MAELRMTHRHATEDELRQLRDNGFAAWLRSYTLRRFRRFRRLYGDSGLSSPANPLLTLLSLPQTPNHEQNTTILSENATIRSENATILAELASQKKFNTEIMQKLDRLMSSSSS